MNTTRNIACIFMILLLLITLSACRDKTAESGSTQHEDLRIVFLEDDGSVDYYETAYNRPIYEFLDRENILVSADSDLYYTHRQRFWAMNTSGVEEFESKLYNNKNVYLTEDIVVYHKNVNKELLEKIRKQYERQ